MGACDLAAACSLGRSAAAVDNLIGRGSSTAVGRGVPLMRGEAPPPLRSAALPPELPLRGVGPLPPSLRGVPVLILRGVARGVPA